MFDERMLFRENEFNQLIARHQRAAMTYDALHSAGGDIDPTQGKKFVEEMLGLTTKYEDFLSRVDFIPLQPNGTPLDSWELNEVGDIRLHTENTAQTHQVTENSSSRTITNKIIDLYAPLSYERVGRWLRRSVGEGAKLGQGVQIILNELKKKFRNEFQRLCILGDDDSTSDDSLSIADGWIKRTLEDGDSSLQNGTSWASSPDILAMLKRLELAAADIRHATLLDNPQLSFIMGKKNHVILKNQLQGTSADEAIHMYMVDAKTGMPKYSGIPIETPSYWPSDLVMLTLRKNLVCGISDEISRDIPLIEYMRDPIAATHKFICRISGGCNIAKTDIILTEYDTNNANYVTWAS